MKTLTSRELRIAADMVDLRDMVKKALGPVHWQRAVDLHGAFLKVEMLKQDCHNPLEVVIPFAKAMVARGEELGIMMAVAVELSEM